MNIITYLHHKFLMVHQRHCFNFLVGLPIFEQPFFFLSRVCFITHSLDMYFIQCIYIYIYEFIHYIHYMS